MEEAQTSSWAGLEAGKASFSAALDQLTGNGRAKITSLPCRDFKRTPEGVEQFFHRAKETAPDYDFQIVMKAAGCHSQHLTDWINQLHPEFGVTIVDHEKAFQCLTIGPTGGCSGRSPTRPCRAKSLPR